MYFLNVIHMMLMSSSFPFTCSLLYVLELNYVLIFRFYSFFYCFSLSVSSTGTDFLVWLWKLFFAKALLFWFNFLFCVILRRNIGAWIHATFLRKYTCKWNLDILKYRITANSCRDNYSFFRLKVRQLFKGDNYSREETIVF